MGCLEVVGKGTTPFSRLSEKIVLISTFPISSSVLRLLCVSKRPKWVGQKFVILSKKTRIDVNKTVSPKL